MNVTVFGMFLGQLPQALPGSASGSRRQSGVLGVGVLLSQHLRVMVFSHKMCELKNWRNGFSSRLQFVPRRAYSPRTDCALQHLRFSPSLVLL